MVPKVVSRGTSFKGAARYLLHDKGADTSERVSWVETRNLQTDNPDTAWRIMAATATDQKRLKEHAGIKATGRKSSLTVQHVMLSWHPEEAEGLTKDQMHAAAEAAIAKLGASDHQAMLISHNDTDKPHVHILLNRVSPIDGRMLPSSKEKLKLSAWAEQYEKDRGKIYCEERVINNAARRRGEYVRGVPSKARHLYELEQRASANDNTIEKTRAEQRKQDAKLSRDSRELERKHKAAWRRLDVQHKEQVLGIRVDTKKAIGRAKDKVRRSFRDRWSEHYHESQAQMRAFEQREQSMLGRIGNRFKSIDLGKIISGQGTGRAIGEAFSAFTSKSGREAAESRRIQEREQALKREQAQAEDQAAQALRAQQQQRLAKSQQRFLAERMQLVLSQQMEKAKLKAQWNKRNKQRKAAHGRHQTPAQDKAGRQAMEAFSAASEQDNKPSTKAGDLLPKKDAEQRAGQADQFKSLAEKRAKRKRHRKRDRGKDDDRGR